MPTRKQLDQRSPEIDPKRLVLLRALYDGGPSMGEQFRVLIPKGYAERDALYDERIKRTTYTNHAASIVDLTTATVVQSPPTIDGLSKPDTEVADWLDDCDRAGTSFAAFGRLVLTDLLVCRRAFVWVDLPARPAGPAPETRAQEEAAGAGTPYLRRIDPLSALNWQETSGVLDWIVLYDRRTVQPDPLATQRAAHRWTVVRPDRMDVYEWIAPESDPGGEPKPDDEIRLNPDQSRPLNGYMPIASYCVTESAWLMGRMQDPAVQLFRAECDLRWYLYRTAVALLKIARKTIPGKAPETGANFYLDLVRDSDGVDEADFIAPPPGAAAPLAADVQASRVALYRVAHQLDQGADPTASTAQQSGESRKLQQAAGDKVLTAYADALRNLLRETMRIVARAWGADGASIKIGGLDELTPDDVAGFLNSAALAVEAKRSPTFVAWLARKQAEMLGAEHDLLDAIEDEVEAAVGAEGTAADLADDAEENDDAEAA